jgi:hypothetical protein
VLALTVGILSSIVPIRECPSAASGSRLGRRSDLRRGDRTDRCGDLGLPHRFSEHPNTFTKRVDVVVRAARRRTTR